MAFLRFTRDRRGYEQFSLVEQATNRRGKSRSRLLYWYRTPPNIRVGREPFDQSVRRALEAQYPTVQFDWRKIVETPIPSAETDRWRERRRAEKTEKAARRALVAEDEAQTDSEEESEIEAEALPIAVADEQEASVDPGSNPTGRRRRRRRGRGRQRVAPQTAGDITLPAPESDETYESVPDLESDLASDVASGAQSESDREGE